MNSETVFIKTIIKKSGFLKKSVTIQWNLLLLPTKLIKKILDPTNTKQYYQSYLDRKILNYKLKILSQSKMS